MRTCAIAALLWCVAAERTTDDELFMLQRKQTPSLATDGRPHPNAGTEEWSLCNKKVTSNLGGKGGISVDELGYPIETPTDVHELRYHEVGNVSGEIVDLRITTIGDYTPYNTEANGRAGCFGQINVAAGTEVHLQFALVSTGTDNILPGGRNLKQNFTIVDMDRSKEKRKGHTIEEVWAKGFANVDDTRMAANRQDGEWYVFQSPEDAIEVENPEDINIDDLTEDQLDSTVSLTFQSVNVWELKFKAVTVGDGNGRNFLWAGETSSCDVPPACMCTPDERLKMPSKLDHYLKWDMCGEDEPVTGNGHVIRYPNVAKMSEGDGTMKVGEQSVDLIVDNVTEYELENPENNGRHGCLGILNLAAPSAVTMRFTLVLAGTDTPVPVDTTFPLTYDFNVFDFDQSASGRMQEMIGVNGFSKLVARPPGIVKLMDANTGTWWMKSMTAGVPEPITDIRSNLTSDQILSSFSVSYRAVSTWDIHFRAELKHPEKFRPRKAKEQGGRNFLFSGESCASWRYYECSCPRNLRRYRKRRPTRRQQKRGGNWLPDDITGKNRTQKKRRKKKPEAEGDEVEVEVEDEAPEAEAEAPPAEAPPAEAPPLPEAA